MKDMINLEQIKKHKIYFVIKLIFTFIFSITLFLDNLIISVKRVENNTYFKEIKTSNILNLILTWIITFLLITIFENFIDKIENTVYIKKERKSKNVKVFIFTLLILLIAWMPYYLSYFPGGIYSDSIRTLLQAINIIPLNNHNPILYAIIMKSFLKIGMKLGGIQLSLELFTIFQILMMAFVFSYFVYWLYKRKISTKYLVMITAFFALDKLIPLYALSLWKDTVFSIAVFVYTIFIAEIILKKGKNLEKILNIIKYVILSILVIFLRNNGIYIVTVVTIIIFLTYRKDILKKLRRFALLSTSLILISCFIQGPIYKYYKINGEFVENLGIPIQQIGYVVVTDGNLTIEQKDFINQICPIDKIKKRYEPWIVDSIKWDKSFNNEFLEKNKVRFLKVWFQIFIQNPDLYVKSYLLNTIGFWDIKQTSWSAYINPTTWYNSEEILGIKQKDYIQKVIGISIKDKILPNKPRSSAIYLFGLLFSMLITIYKKRYKSLVIYLPAILTWFTIMIATPLAFSFRYVYILFLMTPFYFVIPFLKEDEK